MKRKIPLKHYRKYPPELKLAVCKDREKYQRRLKHRGCIQSMSHKGNCLDNSVMKNFFERLKMEIVYLYKVHSLPKLIDEIRECIDYYNYDRVKEKLNGLSPVSYRQRYYEQLL